MYWMTFWWSFRWSFLFWSDYIFILKCSPRYFMQKTLYKTHYNDVIMGAMASQITSLTTVYSTVYSGADQKESQSSASLAFVQGIHSWPVNSPHKGPVMRKMFPFDDIILLQYYLEFIRTGDISVVHWTLFYVLLLHGDQNWIGRILQWVYIIHSKMSQVLFMRQ